MVHNTILHANNFMQELFYYVKDPRLWLKSYQHIIAAIDNVRNLIGVLHKLRYCLTRSLEFVTALLPKPKLGVGLCAQLLNYIRQD